MDDNYPSLDVGSTMDDPYIFITITQSLIWFLGQAEGFFVKKRRDYWTVYYHWKRQPSSTLKNSLAINLNIGGPYSLLGGANKYTYFFP
jgi:hypothetical protein